tara:strand:- start:5150 stop:5497 length:348 start_codon:yes stop_codon:yes gene_type:complete
MTKLTTHCLDTFSGKPAKNMKVDVYFVTDKRAKLKSAILNDNGRSNEPLIEGTNFKEGQYELVFFVGEYFKKMTSLPTIPFLDEVVIKFGVSNPKEHYHVPLLVSPWSYSTYRGS